MGLGFFFFNCCGSPVRCIGGGVSVSFEMSKKD